MNRREFMHSALGTLAVTTLATRPPGARAAPAADSLAREIGITTGSFFKHLTESGEGTLRMLDLPKLMREELDIRVIDLMTATLPSLEPKYCEQLRAAGDRAGCVLTNLKMNQPRLDMASPDASSRRYAIDEYKLTIDSASRLGVRWVRPLPGRAKGADYKLLVASYRELIEYGASRGIDLLIENVGWIKDHPRAIPAIIDQVGSGLKAQPDTGNWQDALRYEGLRNAFPLAASCDFKAFELSTDGTHHKYELRPCFQIGWDAGFRGPWCLEHFHPDLKQLVRELALLRDALRGWMRAPFTR